MNLDVPYAGLLIQTLKGQGLLIHCNQSDLILLEYAKRDGMCKAWCPDYFQPLEFRVELTDKGKEFAEHLILVYSL